MTRRAKTIQRITTKYLSDSLGHCGEVQKQIRVFISHTWRADHTCDSDRRAAWTFTQWTVNLDEHKSFFKWTSMDDRGEVGKFAEWSWFRSMAKKSKLEEQRTDALFVRKLNRADEQLLVIKGLTHSARAGRRQARDDKWNLDSVKAVLNRFQEWKARTEIDTSVDKQKYITTQALDKHRRAPLCTKGDGDTGARCRARFETIWIKELAEAETASHDVDIMLSSPDVREIESIEEYRSHRTNCCDGSELEGRSD